MNTIINFNFHIDKQMRNHDEKISVGEAVENEQFQTNVLARHNSHSIKKSSFKV